MALLFETSILGLAVKVFSDRVEYKTGLGGAIEVVPINQIASIKLGSFLVNRMTIETTGGREYVVTTGKKKEVAEAIYQAQAALRAGPAFAPAPHAGSVADEIAKLARLRADGVLTSEEFERQKQTLLGGQAAPAAMSPPVAPSPTSAAARSAGSLGRTLKIAAIAVVGLSVVVIVLGSVVGKKKDAAAKGGSPSPGSAYDPEHPLAHLFSAEEKKYFGAAGEYLQAVNELDTNLATAMVKTQSGETTLDDIKNAIETASSGEDARYVTFQSATVPSAFAAIDTKIKKCKSLHDSAFKELLKYWKDSNTSHVERGNDTLAQAVKVTNDAIEDLNKTVDRLGNERKNVAATTTAKPKETLQEMLDKLNASLATGWRKPPSDAVAKCTPACRNASSIYGSKTEVCMKLCTSAENAPQIACMITATNKADADKCPTFATPPVKFVVGEQPDVVVLVDLACDVDLLKKLVNGERGLGQAFAPYDVHQLRCADGHATVTISYNK